MSGSCMQPGSKPGPSCVHPLTNSRNKQVPDCVVVFKDSTLNKRNSWCGMNKGTNVLYV